MLFTFLRIILPMLEWSLSVKDEIFLYTCIIKSFKIWWTRCDIREFGVSYCWGLSNCYLFLKVAAHALESSLIKYSAKDYFFRASLCHLCVDAVNAQHAVQRYEEQFPSFGDSREAKLVKALIKVSLFCFYYFIFTVSSI